MNVRSFRFGNMDLGLLLGVVVAVLTNVKEGKIVEYAAYNVVRLDYDRLQLPPMLDGHGLLASVHNNLLKDPSSFTSFIS